LIFGILGIVLDKRKVLAILTTIVAGGFVLLYVIGIIIAATAVVRRG
jgi:hypothetical protein